MFLIVLVNFSELESVEVDIFTNKNNRIVVFFICYNWFVFTDIF